MISGPCSQERNVFLHIGSPKTGSSIIQNTLESLERSGELGRKGFYYELRWTLELFVIAYKIRTTAEDNSSILKEIVELCSNILHATAENNIVISSEELFHAKFASYLREALRNCQTKVIIYIKRQDLFIESWWSEHLKSGWVNISLEEFIEERKEYCHYSEVIDSYAKAFCKENVSVRLYDRKKFPKKDVVADFFECIGLSEVAWSPLELQYSNISLTPEALRVRRRLMVNMVVNQEDQQRLLQSLHQQYAQNEISNVEYVARQAILLRGGLNPDKARFGFYFQCLQSSKITNEVGYIPKERRKKFLDSFAGENAYIAEEYFKKGTLFDETYPSTIAQTENATVNDVIDIVFPVLERMNTCIGTLTGEISNLKNEIASLTNEMSSLRTTQQNYNWKFRIKSLLRSIDAMYFGRHLSKMYTLWRRLWKVVKCP